MTPDGINATTVALTITTDGTVHAFNRAPGRHNGLLFAMFSGLAFGIVIIPAGRRRRVWIALLLVAMLALTGLIACGGSSSSTPKTTVNPSFVAAGTYTVNVTATAGSTSHQTPITVNVTQ